MKPNLLAVCIVQALAIVYLLATRRSADSPAAEKPAAPQQGSLSDYRFLNALSAPAQDIVTSPPISACDELLGMP